MLVPIKRGDLHPGHFPSFQERKILKFLDSYDVTRSREASRHGGRGIRIRPGMLRGDIRDLLDTYPVMVPAYDIAVCIHGVIPGDCGECIPPRCWTFDDMQAMRIRPGANLVCDGPGCPCRKDRYGQVTPLHKTQKWKATHEPET